MLKVDGIGVVYGSKGNRVQAIDQISFETRRGEFISIVGPSGCGKSTLLQCLTGLMKPTTGAVLLDDEPISGPPAGMGVVLQEYGRSLFPWLTVEANVALPLGRSGTRSERQAAVEEALYRVALADAAKQYPWQLSGGMQQRVAIARALVVKPQLLVMDEPFASVDAQTRIELEDLLLQLWQGEDMTVIFVTHDIDESVYLSDRILVLSSRPSSVQFEMQVDLPRPRNQLTTKSYPAYSAMRTKILEEIMGPQERSSADAMAVGADI